MSHRREYELSRGKSNYRVGKHIRWQVRRLVHSYCRLGITIPCSSTTTIPPPPLHDRASPRLQHYSPAPASNSHYPQSIQNWCDVRCDVTRTARTICDCPTPSLTLVPRRRWRYSRVLLPIFPPYLSMQPSQQDLQIPCLSSGGFPRHPSL